MTSSLSQLATEALDRISEATNGHEPQSPYILTREAFSRFYLEEMPDKGPVRVHHGSREDLWVAIASHEARREFKTLERCESWFQMTTTGGGLMEWVYETTSRTRLFALDRRDSEPPDGVFYGDTIHPFGTVLPWQDSAWPGGRKWARIEDGFYAVIIPAERDVPGGNAWTQIRLAIAGLEYRDWMQENNANDEISIARVQVRHQLSQYDHFNA
jgi:hypothetical protein